MTELSGANGVEHSEPCAPQLIPEGEEDVTVPLLGVGLTVNTVVLVNAAVTASAAAIVTVQLVVVPEHAPPHPANA